MPGGGGSIKGEQTIARNTLLKGYDTTGYTRLGESRILVKPPQSSPLASLIWACTIQLFCISLD